MRYLCAALFPICLALPHAGWADVTLPKPFCGRHFFEGFFTETDPRRFPLILRKSNFETMELLSSHGKVRMPIYRNSNLFVVFDVKKKMVSARNIERKEYASALLLAKSMISGDGTTPEKLKNRLHEFTQETEVKPVSAKIRACLEGAR